MIRLRTLSLSTIALLAIGAVQAGEARPTSSKAGQGEVGNSDAAETACPSADVPPRAGGLVAIAPDDLGTTAYKRDCTVLTGTRDTAQVGHSIEVSDRANGPTSGSGIATAASASYALSLVNLRPDWPSSTHSGETDGLSIVVRQGRSDTAAILTNVGVRTGFATTLESYTFAADQAGRAMRGVRTQLGVVNSRDGGEFGLLVQAENGSDLTSGLRIASLGSATWKNYLEAIDPAGKSVAYIRGSDGAIVAGDVIPTADLRKSLGTPEARYNATYTQVLQLAPAAFAALPTCSAGTGGGTLAYIADAQKLPKAWGEVVIGGGGRYKVFAKCDGVSWRSF